MSTPSRKPPIPLRDAFDFAELCESDPCDISYTLGSFWIGSRRSFESRLVKAFKGCVPADDFEPHISHFCRFYASLIVDRAAVGATNRRRFDWVLRVLSSAEAQPDPTRPQSLLVDVLCSLTGARNGTDVFFKSGARPPMRVVDRLGGPEMLKARLRYVSQDLFARPGQLSGSVLLIDDICNTGASIRIYAAAAKKLLGAGQVTAVNLAATRFARGKDGWGMLQLDVSGLAKYPSLGQMWIDKAAVYHLREDCPLAQSPVSCEVRFMAERSAKPCPNCCPKPAVARKWWKIW